MRVVIEYIKLFLATIGSCIAWFLGGMDGVIFALIAFIVVDYITGMAVAYQDKKLSSSIGVKGFLKKVTILLLVGVANMFDTYVIKEGAVFRTTVTFYYMANEGLSIVENCAILGLPIPQKLKEALIQLKERSDENGGSKQ